MELDELLEAKSRELKDLQDKKIISLNDEIRYKDTQLESIRGQFTELKESFQFNLDLLADRDKELCSYDQIITNQNEKNDALLAELSDIKIELANFKQQMLEEEAKKEEVRKTYQNKVKEVEDSLEREYISKENKLSLELTEVARVKQQLEIRLADLQEDSERKQREWERNFEEEISTLLREHSSKLSSSEGRTFQAESKLKQVTAEREAVRLQVSELEEVITSQNSHITKMEEAVEHAEWDVNNYISAQKSRISELGVTIKRLTNDMDDKDKIMSNKLSVSESHIVEKDRIISRLREQHEIDISETEIRNRDLSSELEQCKIADKCKMARFEDQLVDANDNILQMETKLKEYKVQLEVAQEKCARHEVNLKMCEQQTDDKLRELRVDLEMKKKDIARYKLDLAVAVKREEALKCEKEQEIKLMTMKCEKADQRAYYSQEEVVRDLVKARDIALADGKRLKTDNKMLEDEVKILKGQIKRCEVPGDSEVVNEELAELQHQNDQLKEVIRQMSTDMGNLATVNKTLSDSKIQSHEDRQNPEKDITILDENEKEILRKEIMYLRKMITSQKNKELSQIREDDEFVLLKARLELVEKERDRLLELSNSLRCRLNETDEQKGVPLKEITSRINTARSAMSSNSRIPRRKKSSSTDRSDFSLLHMSGDTSLNEELSDICRMVEQEENRPLSAAGSTVEVKGKQINPKSRESIPPPQPVFRGRKNVPQNTQPQKKIRNYNVK